jgi:zinc finger SWIM domain-containing protein 3
LIASQKKILELQASEFENFDDFGIKPKAADELASHQVGGPLNLCYTCHDRKNHLQSKQPRVGFWTS